MHDPAMNDILSKFNAVGNKSASTSAPQQSRSSSSGDPAMHNILSKFAAVSGTQSALKTPGQLALSEGLGAEQKRVGQLPQDFEPSNVSVVKHGDPHPMKDKFVGEASNPVDTVTMDVPLMIRMFEYAREEAKSDMDLHDVAEKLIALGTGGSTLTMDNYEDIVSNVENGIEDHEMDEAAGEKFGDEFYAHDPAGRSTPTVDGYHQTRDLETGSYTDHMDHGPISTQTTYDKSGQMTSQHAQARVGDRTMAKSRFYPKKKVGEAEYHTTVGSMMDKGQGKWDMDALSDAGIDKYTTSSQRDQLQKDYGDNWRDKVRQGVRDIKVGGSIDDYGSNASVQGYVDVGGARTTVGVDVAKGGKNDTNSMAGSELSVNGHTFKAPKFDNDATQQQAADYATQQAKKLFQDQYSDQDWTGPGRGSIEKAIDSATTADQLEKQGSLSGGVSGETHRAAGAEQEIANLRKLAGQQAPGYSTDELAKIGKDRLRNQEQNLFSEDYVGGKEAPQDLVKSLSKSYRDFVKEVEQQNAAKPDRELRSKTEKPKKFGNILDEE